MRTLHILNLPPGGEESTVVRLVLQLALEVEERQWVRKICREQHYLHREVNGQARWVAYVVIREEGTLHGEHFVVERRDRVGALVFSRMESTRCKGWYGSLDDVKSGWARLSQWELLTLSRCWLDPRIQRGGIWHIPKAASMVMKESLAHIHFDYLLCYPPSHFSQPWQIREVISYCQSDRFLCMTYWFARFKLVRENKKGLKTFMHSLPALTEEQARLIQVASRSNKAARRKRNAGIVAHEVLLIVKRKRWRQSAA